MGLDGVEIIMATEEEFSVELQEAECAQLRTVEDLVNLIATKMNCTAVSGVTSKPATQGHLKTSHPED